MKPYGFLPHSFGHAAASATSKLFLPCVLILPCSQVFVSSLFLLARLECCLSRQQRVLGDVRPLKHPLRDVDAVLRDHDEDSARGIRQHLSADGRHQRSGGADNHYRISGVTGLSVPLCLAVSRSIPSASVFAHTFNAEVLFLRVGTNCAVSTDNMTQAQGECVASLVRQPTYLPWCRGSSFAL